MPWSQGRTQTRPPTTNLANADPGQILNRPIRRTALQFIQFRSAGGDRKRFCADELSALHVVGRIAHNHDLLGLETLAKDPTTALQRRHGNMITILMVIGKTAEREKLPKPVLAQLDLGPKLDVAGEQAERGRFRQGLQLANQLEYAGTRMADTGSQNVIEPEDITIEKLSEMPGRLIQPMDAEKFAHQAYVRPSGKSHLFRAMMQVEFRGKCLCKRPRTGMTGVHQRAVNVEKY